MKHPNAATAGTLTGPAIVIVWLAGLLGIDMGAEVGAAVAGCMIATGLLIGRNGVKGLARILWRGHSNG